VRRYRVCGALAAPRPAGRSVDFMNSRMDALVDRSRRVRPAGPSRQLGSHLGGAAVDGARSSGRPRQAAPRPCGD
jgi:hypothetical protein